MKNYRVFIERCKKFNSSEKCLSGKIHFLSISLCYN